MPLRSSSPAQKSPSGSPPYPSPSARRVPGQPKSTRQQFSACGACRMRRVRCDLKDLPFPGNGQHQQCSNCKERGLKCVDEFAEVKAVKLLRRGRRLQQVEAVYGKTMDEDGGLFNAPSLQPSLIPKLKPEFFSSVFFHRFQIQHPIIDPAEFGHRFFEYSKGHGNALGVAGQLIAMLLVVWAASFGVNEYGIEDVHQSASAVRSRRDNVNDMVREIMQLVDVHGIMRKPSWDGVRVLLLLMPLTSDVQSLIERQVFYETTVSHVFTLCNLATVASVSNGQGQAADMFVRARIFWYTHYLEGIKSGLRGGRLLLSDDDLDCFQKSLPLPNSGNMTASQESAYAFSYRLAILPLHIASICRNIHSVLTGPKTRQHDTIDEQRLHEVWAQLEQSWEDLDELRGLPTAGIHVEEDVDRYIHSWKIFIFECLSVIREALKQRVVVHSSQERALEASVPGSPARSAPHDPATRLLRVANSKCHELVKHVVAIARGHLNTSFFEYDAALVRDGVFYAGYFLASDSGSDEEIQVCLQALHQMRWVFAQNEDKEKAVRMAWGARKASDSRHSSISTTLSPADFDAFVAKPGQIGGGDAQRPIPTPLSIPPFSSTSLDFSMIAESSAPSTASTEDGLWASPPLSAATSSGTHSPHDEPLAASLRASPASTRMSAGGSPSFFTAAPLHPSPFSRASPGSSADSTRLSPPLMFFPNTSDLGTYTFAPSTQASGLASTRTQHTPLSNQERSNFSDSMSSFFSSHTNPTSLYTSRSSFSGTDPLDHTFSLQPSFFH
ncbi:hypothetical protein FA95DRAFT_1551599 [Auriscalpium vulgare]|uniref:Uncharacterized protein n=1 Tax=Auriscalpium vulgare TaxID=40419 RepID=A0ACB8SC98_9AGAM|nr:hypothetical protein FA95DRAFT_1551599 [Auriscalpium vulgare]